MTQPIQSAAYWDQTADSYIDIAEPFTAQFCGDAVELAGIEPGMTLLDIATGPGALALAAARAGASVTAIDFSQGMIDRIAARAAGMDIDARQMDGQALDLPSDHFDRVCSVFGIPLFPDWQAGLREMARVLRPGGRAVLGVAANPWGFGPNQLFAEARRAVVPDREIDNGLPGMTALHEVRQLTEELGRVGLSDIVIHSRAHEITVPVELLTRDNPMIAANPLIVDLELAVRDKVIAKARVIAERWRRGDAVRMPGIAHLAVAAKAPAEPATGQ